MNIGNKNIGNKNIGKKNIWKKNMENLKEYWEKKKNRIGRSKWRRLKGAG